MRGGTHGRTSLRTEALLYGPEALTGCLLTGGSAYGTSANTGRRRLRDEPPYGPEAEAYRTSLLTGRRRWDEPPYGPEAEALTGRASLRDGALITGGAYGTSLFTGRRRLRDASLRAEALTGRALYTGRRRLRDKPVLRGGGGGLRDGGAGDEPPYGPEAEAPTGRASLRDEPLARRHSWKSLLTNESSLRAGGAYGTPP